MSDLRGTRQVRIESGRTGATHLQREEGEDKYILTEVQLGFHRRLEGVSALVRVDCGSGRIRRHLLTYLRPSKQKEGTKQLK